MKSRRKVAGIELQPEQTMTREAVMKAREEDEEKIKSGEVKLHIGIQKVVKGYNVT